MWGIMMTSRNNFQSENLTLMEIFADTLLQLKAWTNWMSDFINGLWLIKFNTYIKALQGEHWASNSSIFAVLVGVGVVETSVTWFANIVPYFDYYIMGGQTIWGTIVTMNIHFYLSNFTFCFI